jgi:hypothetical protein
VGAMARSTPYHPGGSLQKATWGNPQEAGFVRANPW